jgi:hypothetical protein
MEQRSLDSLPKHSRYGYQDCARFVADTKTLFNLFLSRPEKLRGGHKSRDSTLIRTILKNSDPPADFHAYANWLLPTKEWDDLQCRYVDEAFGLEGHIRLPKGWAQQENPIKAPKQTIWCVDVHLPWAYCRTTVSRFVIDIDDPEFEFGESTKPRSKKEKRKKPGLSFPNNPPDIDSMARLLMRGGLRPVCIVETHCGGYHVVLEAEGHLFLKLNNRLAMVCMAFDVDPSLFGIDLRREITVKEARELLDFLWLHHSVDFEYLTQDPTQSVLRVPGSVNAKSGYVCHWLLFDEWQTYSPQDIEGYLNQFYEVHTVLGIRGRPFESYGNTPAPKEKSQVHEPDINLIKDVATRLRKYDEALGLTPQKRNIIARWLAERWGYLTAAGCTIPQVEVARVVGLPQTSMSVILRKMVKLELIARIEERGYRRPWKDPQGNTVEAGRAYEYRIGKMLMGRGNEDFCEEYEPGRSNEMMLQDCRAAYRTGWSEETAKEYIESKYEKYVSAHHPREIRSKEDIRRIVRLGYRRKK